MSEPRESSAVQINSQWRIGSAQCIDSHVKLLTSDQQRIIDVFLDNIGLSLRVFRIVSEVVFPLGDLLQFVKEKNADPLRFSDGLHYPQTLAILVFLELLAEDGVFAW